MLMHTVETMLSGLRETRQMINNIYNKQQKRPDGSLFYGQDNAKMVRN